MTSMNVLVTGGAGYIGSHACKRLLAAGHRVVIVDNLYRGHEVVAARLRSLPGVADDRVAFHKLDVQDRHALQTVMHREGVDAVMHFAALAYVRESMDHPLDYYRANTAAAVSLLEAIDALNISRLVFSSTCATYGEPDPAHIPIKESCPQRPINPYGWSKLYIEQMVLDLMRVRKQQNRPFAAAMLRYFNVAGCDRSGALGEDHTPETHIIPIMLQVAMGTRPHVTVFGADHPTPDGTCVRDYIHVEDLVDAHAVVLSKLAPERFDTRAYNLGIGRGHSIREVLAAVRRVTGHAIPVVDGPRHPGDPPTLFCDPSAIDRDMGWRATTTDIDEIVRTAWHWFRNNPRGYKG
jgi:UDP-glucose 4-epimerase